MVVRTRIEPVKMATPAGLEPKIPLQNTVYTDQITDQYEPYWKKPVTPEVAGSSPVNRIIRDSIRHTWLKICGLYGRVGLGLAAWTKFRWKSNALLGS